MADETLCDLVAGSLSIGPDVTFEELVAGTDPTVAPRLIAVWLWATNHPDEVAALGPYRPALLAIVRRGDALSRRSGMDDVEDAWGPLPEIEVTPAELRSAAAAQARSRSCR